MRFYIFTLLFFAVTYSYAQERVRIGPRASAVVERRGIFYADPVEESYEDYNLKAGDTYLKLGYSFQFGYETNPSNATVSSNKDESAYATNYLRLGLLHDVIEGLTLQTNINIGYKEFFEGDNEDGLVVDIDTETGGDESIGVEFNLGEKTLLSLTDSIQVNVDQIEDLREEQNSNESYFLENDFGIQLYHELEEESGFGIKIGRRDVHSLNGEFKERNREEYYAGIEYTTLLVPRLLVSPYLTYTDFDYESRPFTSNSDAETIQAGLIFDYDASETMTVSLKGGWQDLSFDEGADSEGFDGNLRVQHIISEFAAHALDLGYRFRVSNSSSVNAAEDTYLTYTYEYEFNSQLMIRPTFSWLHSEDDVSGGEKYDIFVPSISLRYKFTEKLSGTLDYSYTEKTSNIDSEFVNNHIFFRLSYDF